MRALPRVGTKHEQVTGLICPDCPGVLEVTSHEGHMRFRCRIGHTYSLQELIESKEDRLDAALWAPVTALEELTVLLRELIAQGKDIGDPRHLEERAARTEQLARKIRDLIEENQPANLGSGTVRWPDDEH